ncbi:Rv3235 family protein [Streptomyces noursei]|uniref:Rv3235 family protein n=1 Tax=Streptomyces noursei TaxID=1971 RepID=UPI0033187650
MTDTTTEHTTATGATTDARPAPAEPAPHAPRPDGAPPRPPATGPAPAPTVPRPRRSPTDGAPATPPAPVPPPAAPRRGTPAPRRGTRRPTGPAGRGPGSPGNRGPTRTPHLTRTSAGTSTQRRTTTTPDTPLPTPGARHRALENRPHLWFAHQLLLALSDQRPVHALLGHALPAAYDRLAELAPLSPLRPYVAPGLRAPVPALHACGLCRPRDGVIEAFARITTGARLRALAFRLERGGDARWRCAALDLGPVP